MERYSPQREAIWQALCSTKEHPSAEAVYRCILPDNPRMSLGTVYRNLSLFVEKGMARKVTSYDGVEHFDADLRPHSHFVCRSCGCILDVWNSREESLESGAGNELGALIEGHETTFFGRCRKCVEAENTEQSVTA